MDNFENTEENIAKDCRDIKRALKVYPCEEGTEIIAVVEGKYDDERTNLYELSASMGTPLNNEVYDLVRDVYHISCVDYLNLGSIPVSYMLSMVDAGWDQYVPLPASVVKRYLSEDQKQRLKNWKANYPKERFFVWYLQGLSLY